MAETSCHSPTFADRGAGMGEREGQDKKTERMLQEKQPDETGRGLKEGRERQYLQEKQRKGGTGANQCSTFVKK